MWASAPTNNNRTPYSTSVGGDAHIAPPIGVQSPTFQTISGSGGARRDDSACKPPCLSLRERCPSGARTERGTAERSPKACKPLSVTCGDSSPKGRAKGLLHKHEKWSVSVPIRSINCFTAPHQRMALSLSHRVRGSQAANKIRSVFCGGVYAAKNTLRVTQCHSPAVGGARRGVQRIPLPQKGCALLR